MYEVVVENIGYFESACETLQDARKLALYYTGNYGAVVAVFCDGYLVGTYTPDDAARLRTLVGK